MNVISKRKQRQTWKRRLRKSPKSFCIVYALCDEAGSVRYIGQTRLPPSDRLAWYYRKIARKIAANERLSPVEKWIDELSYHERVPTIIVVDPNATWDVSEIIYIERHRRAGADLLNVTRGGRDGIGNAKREAR